MWIENQDEEQKQTLDGQPSIGAGGGAAQFGTSGITGNPSTINPIQPQQPQQKFASVQDYLGANKQQGEDLGQKFTSNLTETAGKEKAAVDAAVTGAQNDITAGTASYDPNLTAKAFSTPTEVANDPGQLGSFLKQWNASYKGPSSFETSDKYNPAIKAANEAAEKAAQLETVGGQQQLLQDQFNVYGQGNKGLDQVLLQNSSAYPAVQQLQPAFQSINDYLKAQSSDINTQAQQAKSASESAKTKTQEPFANNLTKFQTDLTGRTTAAQQKAKDTLTKYQQDLASADPAKIEADLKESGVDTATTKNIVDYLSALNTDYGIKPNISSAYIGNPNVDINPSTVATPEDYAKAEAYGKLTGVDYSGVLNPADVSKAGTGTLQQNAFKSNDLAGYLKGGLEIQDKSLMNQPINPVDVLTSIGTDTAKGMQLVNQYLNAATRTGVKLDPTKRLPPGPLRSLYEGLQVNQPNPYRPQPTDATFKQMKDRFDTWMQQNAA